MGGQIEDCGFPDFKSVIQPHELPAQSELDQLAKSYGRTRRAGGWHSSLFSFTAIVSLQAVINHPWMPHMSPPNRSTKWRRALLLRFRQRTTELPVASKADWAAVFRGGAAFVREAYSVNR